MITKKGVVNTKIKEAPPPSTCNRFDIIKVKKLQTVISNT